MDNVINTYLFYNSEFAETDTWDFKFAYFLGTIVQQVTTTFKQKIFCNFDIPGTQYKEPDKCDFNSMHAIVLIHNSSKNVSNPFEKLGSYLNFEDEVIKNKTFIVLRRPSQSKASKNIYLSFQCYMFYELNHRTLQSIEYDPDVPGDSENGYWAVLSDLAYDIKLVSDQTSSVNQDRKNTIFLAEVSKDQSKNRERIKRELLFSGFRVLPVHPLPAVLSDFEKKVKSLLSESILSIHILGEMYGDSPENTDYSFPELQNRLYSQLETEQKITPIEPKIQRVIWMPPNLDEYDEKQKQYLKRIKKEISSSESTELVQSTIFDLKEIIERRIKQALSNVFEFIHEEQSKEILIIFLKKDELLRQETLSIFNKKNFQYQVLDLESAGFDDNTSLIGLLKQKKFILIINNQKNILQLNSVLSILVRTKGYADALPAASLGLLSSSKVDKYEDYLPVNIQPIYFEQNNLQEKIELYLSKINA